MVFTICEPEVRTENISGLVDHLFRREAGKMVAYLTRFFGLSRLDLAEDVVQDTLCRALETWPLHGVPENPSAWLMRVARNRAIDAIRRDQHLQYFTPELTEFFTSTVPASDETTAFEKEIQDDQLRMMFACCNPELSIDAQITLILKTLCGFSVAEIGHALLTSSDSIEKRLVRARKIFRTAPVELDAPADIPNKLAAVHQAIYLLFNEGYHGSQTEQAVREDLCFEAIRLAVLLTEHPKTQTPNTFALVALLCFHAARLGTRTDDSGDLVQLQMQDRSKWDRELITNGFLFLEKASEQNALSEYHLEAAIASVHCAAAKYEETEWTKIVELYDLLYRLTPSPIVALNRAVAVGKAMGPEKGLHELRNLHDAEKLKKYPFFPAAQGEFELLIGRRSDAAKHFEEALRLARNEPEKKFFQTKVGMCVLKPAT